MKLLCSLLFLATSAAASAPHIGAQQAPGDLSQALEGWRGRHGPLWQLVPDATGQGVRLLYGGAIEPAAAPADEDAVRATARDFLVEARDLLAVDPATLVHERTAFLPLGTVGSGDKWTVRFRQVVDGLPVRRGSVNVLLDADGRMLSIDNAALPIPEDFIPAPTRPAAEALADAGARFLADEGRPFADAPGLSLSIERERTDAGYVPTLAWQVELSDMTDRRDPAAARYSLAATGEPRLLGREELVHSCDVTGEVRVKATPGLGPDSSANPESVQVVPDMTVTSLFPLAVDVTNAAGAFDFPGVSSLNTVAFMFSGPYANVNNEMGSDFSMITSLSGDQNVLLNSGTAAGVTAQANAFLHVGAVRDWIRSVVPGDSMADFQATVNVNIDDVCNAYYTSASGGSVNFFLQGSKTGETSGGTAYTKTCNNTAYSTVVYHEMGHWLNVKYGSGNGSDGFGEGAADVWAMYIADDPVVGEDWATVVYETGSSTTYDLRTGNNTVAYCGDGNGGCYGEVHSDGEPLMGALWKVRDHLNTSLGDAAGDAVADELFVCWMNAYDDGQIDSVIETHWLVLDDDDGNIFNGTPHFEEIEAGFTDQGFPGFQTLGTVWVDGAHWGIELGLSMFPFDTVEEGAFVVSDGGTVIIEAGAYDELLTLEKPMTLEANNGSVSIGD